MPRVVVDLTRWFCRAALLAGILAGAGCAGFTPQPGPGAEPAARYVTLTQPVVVFGDTQEHEITGVPLHDNDSAVDAYLEVTQRPPEQPMFGRRVLDWVLHRHPDEPFIHLGDVLDLSCRSEAERMSRIFSRSGRPGAVLPGNHDGLMFGIFGYDVLSATLDPDARRWNEACRRGAAVEDARFKSDREAFSKRDFINTAIGEYARVPDLTPGLGMLPAAGEHRLSWENLRPGAFVTGIEARLRDGYQYADSFLAQRIRLPRASGATADVFLIALDTNQAGPLVSTWDMLMGRSPGSMGHVHVDQLRAVTHWVLQAVRNGDLVVFAGHHNWGSLGLPTRLLLGDLMANVTHPLVYLSAHTHRGFWALHRNADRRPLLELNVSSLSDWPIAYRRVRFAFDNQVNRLLVQAEIHPNAGRPVTGDRDLMAAWLEEACAEIGPEPDAFYRFDRDLVQRQREGRGTLPEWITSGFAPVCDSCAEPLYRHAHQYLDEALDAILQLANHLGQRAHGLYDLTLPDWCGDSDFHDCARFLQSQRPDSFAATVQSFRRKAVLVDLLARSLDSLEGRQSVAYMTCRAVQAAKLDFDATDETSNNLRSEANRRAEQFFRVEASVGME